MIENNTPDLPAHKNGDVIAKFVALVAELLESDMTQADYDKLREIAGILNPNGRGFVAMLNRDVEKRFPNIQRRD